MDVKQRPKLRWLNWRGGMVALLALPFYLYSVALLLDLEPREPAPPTVDDLLAQARQRDTVLWKTRRLCYDQLPERVIDFLGMEHPGDPLDRQAWAIRRLQNHPEAVDRIVPVLTNMMSNPAWPGIDSVACETLAVFGTNALAALPAVLTVICNHPLHGDLNAWQAVFSIQPTNDVVGRLALDTLDAAIQSSRIRWTSEAGFAVLNIAYFLPATGIAPEEIETVFAAALDAGEARIVDTFLSALVSDHYREDMVERLLRLWDERAPLALKGDSVFAAVLVAAKHAATQDQALNWFQEFLAHHPRRIQNAPTLMAQMVIASEEHLREPVVSLVAAWLNTHEAGHPEALGSFFDAKTGKHLWEHPAAREWIERRATAPDNPHQVADWGRHWMWSGDVVSTLRQAVVLLQSGDRTKATAVAVRLSWWNPAIDDQRLNQPVIRGYGRVTPDDAEDFKNRALFQSQLGHLPARQAAGLLADVRVAVHSLDDDIPDKTAALRRIDRWLGETKLRAEVSEPSL